MSAKIAFISHSFGRGGAEKYLYDFIRYCCEEGVKCLVIGPRSGPQLEDLRRLGVEVVPISLTSIIGSSVILRCWQFLKICLNTVQVMRVLLRFQPNLVYSNTSVIVSGALASRILSLHHFWHIHENFRTMEFPSAIPHKALRRIIENLSTKAIFVSHSAMISMFPNGSCKAVVIHNGVDISRFRLLPDTSKIKNKPQLCFVGALEHRKGVDLLLRALALLIHEGGKTVSLDIWGSGDLDDSALLKNLAEKLGIRKEVRFLGHTSNVHEILPQYDVLVVPSRGESFSLVALEGMAAGVPVVATRCGGPEEIIDDGITGHLVDVGDYRQMAKAITAFLDDPAYARLVAQRARTKALHSFNLQGQLQRIMKLILPNWIPPAKRQSPLSHTAW